MVELALTVSSLVILVAIGVSARLLVNSFPTVPFTIVLVIIGLVIAILPIARFRIIAIHRE